MDGVGVRYISLEDLIVMKMLAGRPRDLEDVASMLRKNRDFDRGHVEQWLGECDRELDSGLSERFRQMMAELL